MLDYFEKHQYLHREQDILPHLHFGEGTICFHVEIVQRVNILVFCKKKQSKTGKIINELNTLFQNLGGSKL